MNRPLWWLVCSVLGIVAVTGCQHAAPSPTASESTLRARDFYPLKVGNRWTYQIQASGQTVERTIQILREEDGYFVDNTNGRLRMDATGLRDEHRYLLENPIEEGRKWFAVISVQTTENFEITDAGHPCTVKAGTFGSCVTVHATTEFKPGKQIVIESTYAQGVGLVALQTSQVERNNTMLQMQLELRHISSRSRGPSTEFP